jgi:uncharacterized protein YutE (UPF0331/DUF86 family)
MRYLFSRSLKEDTGDVIIPTESVQRWERQVATNYEDLSEEEKDSDRIEANKYLNVIKDEVIDNILDKVWEIEGEEGEVYTTLIEMLDREGWFSQEEYED